MEQLVAKPAKNDQYIVLSFTTQEILELFFENMLMDVGSLVYFPKI